MCARVACPTLLRGPSTSPLERMQAFIAVVIGLFSCILLGMQWLIGWGFLFSPSLREKIRRDLQTKSRFSRTAEVLMIAFGFVVVNGLIAAILWRVFVGPIKPIHEW